MAVSKVVDPALTKLSDALDKRAWFELQQYDPEVADGVSIAVASKQTPESIKRFVVGQTGRSEFGLRCEQAARHLQRIANN